MNKVEPFKEGHPETSLSAEEMNARIVRPLNQLLAMIAKPPLRITKDDTGWILYDQTAIDSESPNGLGAASPTGPFTINGRVTAICALPLGGFIIGGDFTEVGGVVRNHLAQLSFGTSYEMDEVFYPYFGFEAVLFSEHYIHGFAISDGLPIMFGKIETYEEAPDMGNIRRLTATAAVDPAFIPGKAATGPVFKAVTLDDGKVIVAGGVGPWWGDDDTGQSIEGLIRLNADGTLDTSFVPEYDGYIRAPFDSYSPVFLDCLIQPDGKIVVCGSPFRTTLSAFPAEFNGIARFNADGTKDTGWNLQSGSHKYTAIVLQADGKIIAAGTNDLDPFGFDSSPPGGFIRYNTDGTIDATYEQTSIPETNIAVYALTLNADGNAIAAGVFAPPGSGYHFAGVILDEDGEIDIPLGGWIDGQMSPDGKGLCLAFEGTDIIMGGDFETFTYPTTQQPYLARFDSAGNHKPITDAL